MLEQLPPHDIAAEESVLAAVMVDPAAMSKVRDILAPGDFFRERNGWVYEAQCALYDRDGAEAVNEVTVAHELARQKQRSGWRNPQYPAYEPQTLLEDCGGLAFLSRVVAELPTTIGIEWNAQIVWRDARWRELISAGTQIARWAYEGGADFAGVRRKALDLLQGIEEEKHDRDD